MSSSPSTLFQRAKKTGYLMGPKHRYGPAMDDMAEKPAGPPSAPGDDGEADQGPPNLRDAGSVIDSCSDCDAYQPADVGTGGQGQCGKFNSPVAPNQVCDEFEQKGDTEDGNEEGSGPPVQEIPGPQAR
jgi:hypothetical protein